MPPCSHLDSVEEINLEEIKRKMVEGHCDHCEKSGSDLWVCLQRCCSFVGCGRFSNNHIELHSQEANHHLCLHLQDLRMWCFSCRAEVQTSGSSGSGSSNVSGQSGSKAHEVLDIEDSLELEKGLTPRGLCGLANIGNTCYMNAALQALSNCPPLTQYFLECSNFGKEVKNTGVSKNYSLLVSEIWSRKRPKYVVPSQLLRSVRLVNSQFRGYGQQDAQEFLRCIMDQLHEELKQPVPPLSEEQVSSDSDDDEPNHHNKRLLGGTSLPHNGNLHDGDDDVDMYSDSGEDTADDKPLHVSTTEEQPSQDGMPHGDSKAKRRKTNGEPLGVNDVTVSVEDEPMNDAESEQDDQVDRDTDADDSALIQEEKPVDQSAKEVVKHSITEQPKKQEVAESSKTKRPVNYNSIVTDLFDGTIQSSVQCLTCHRVSSRAETFQDVSLPIPGKDELTVLHASQCTALTSCSSMMDRDQDKSWMVTIFEWLRRWFLGPQVTLHDCLSAFFSADELKGDNMYSCEKCKKLRNGIKLCKVMHLPEILCIHLKRFKHEMYFSSKINHFISFPLTGLDMKPFLVKDFNKLEPTQRCTTYDLVAVITHHGNVGAGHYVTFAKNYINGKWYEFNDSWVSEVSDSYVSDIEAYVLFYRKSSEQATKERQTFYNLLKDSQASELRYFVSKKWLTKFQSCMEPGPIANTDFMCTHGAIHPLNMERIQDITVPLPQTVWTHLQARFGGGPPATALNICKHCKRALDELERRREREMKTFKKLNHDYPANDTVDMYCISMRWFRQWEMFVKGQEQDPPGPIDNSNILFVKGNTRLLRNNSDYGQLSLETWRFLHDIYGGGPVFYTEGEKDNEEKRDQEQDEQVQQE